MIGWNDHDAESRYLLRKHSVFFTTRALSAGEL